MKKNKLNNDSALSLTLMVIMFIILISLLCNENKAIKDYDIGEDSSITNNL